ncbi:hypothetical protein GJ699_13135 [Duganella sp. FT80W]|uniref:Uncharacterized protein n=1 Tax=Duganella guangzhouensis TaxID=2666084 RepID=A0A6I2L142_9BURK|nr:hypothetical protein [Duganella guangzhouensis]MRW90937.1 hypothetical protein [Duganella guangzhouensis]
MNIEMRGFISGDFKFLTAWGIDVSAGAAKAFLTDGETVGITHHGDDGFGRVFGRCGVAGQEQGGGKQITGVHVSNGKFVLPHYMMPTWQCVSELGAVLAKAALKYVAQLYMACQQIVRSC